MELDAGQRLRIYFDEDDTWYRGTIRDSKGGQLYHLEYDDGEDEWIYLSRETFELEDDDEEEVEDMEDVEPLRRLFTPRPDHTHAVERAASPRREHGPQCGQRRLPLQRLFGRRRRLGAQSALFFH